MIGGMDEDRKTPSPIRLACEFGFPIAVGMVVVAFYKLLNEEFDARTWFNRATGFAACFGPIFAPYLIWAVVRHTNLWHDSRRQNRPPDAP
jgi:hypothetical protein